MSFAARVRARRSPPPALRGWPRQLGDRFPPVLEPGDTAPDFTLARPGRRPGRRSPTCAARPSSSTSTRGPTRPGCTTQACGVRDRRADYEARRRPVIGVSPDESRRSTKFADKYELGFTLLADADHAVAERYGDLGREEHVRQEVHGRRSARPSSSTPRARSRSVFPKVSPKTHDDAGAEGARRAELAQASDDVGDEGAEQRGPDRDREQPRSAPRRRSAQ